MDVVASGCLVASGTRLLMDIDGSLAVSQGILVRCTVAAW